MSSAPFPLIGELASLGSALSWAIATTIYSRFGLGISAASLNLFKSVISVVGMVVLAAIMGLPWPTSPSLYLWLGASGLVGLALGDTALFAAFKRIGAQLTTSIQCLAPPIAAVIATICLREHLTSGETIGMLVTAGATFGLVYLRGREEKSAAIAGAGRRLGIGIALALFSAVCQGGQIVISRFALADIDVVVGTAMRLMPAVVLLIIMLGVQRTSIAAPSIPLSGRAKIWLTFAAVLGTFVGLMLMSLGAKYAKAGVAGALSSTYPIWIMLISRVVVKEKFSAPRVAMSFLAVLGVVILVTTG